MLYYTGIGARETPKEILSIFNVLGTFLAKKGYVLRSGHAQGADQSFEIGCDKANGKKEIYLPWRNFENSNSNLIVTNIKAFDIAKEHHPYWGNLRPGAKKLLARNSHQILGIDLNTPSQFVICYTKQGKEIGGTSQALRVAKYFNVPILNVGKYKTVAEIKKEINKFLKWRNVKNEF